MTTKTTGTVPGDQGGEPRRPQVGDTVAVRVDFIAAWESAVVEDVVRPNRDEPYVRAEGLLGWFPHASEGLPRAWRWPATQGTAVAGPACVCPFPRTSCPACSYRTDERYLCEACATASPTADVGEWERARARNCCLCGVTCSMQYTIDMAGISPLCWTCALLEPDAARRIHAHVAAERAAKAALEVQLAEALKACPRCVSGVCSAHQPLEGQLSNMRDERDALAAQLKATREALAEIVDPYRAGRDGSLITILVTVEQWGRARAALTASGPGEGTP